MDWLVHENQLYLGERGDSVAFEGFDLQDDGLVSIRSRSTAPVTTP
jgi:hypothetical protein